MIARCSLMCLAFTILTGCCSHTTTAVQTPPPQTRPHGQFTLSGAVVHPGSQPLQNGETVSQALHQAAYVEPNPNPLTVVLIRHGPDGKTRELINVGPTGQLMDAKQDYTLRDGDELVIPASSTAPSDLPMDQHRP